MTSLLQQLQTSRQRQLVVLRGSERWCTTEAERLLSLEMASRIFSDRTAIADAIPFSKADSCLGGEASCVLVDFFEGINPDILCIAAGLVRAGGVLVILAPTIAAWQQRRDQYALWQNQNRSLRPYFAQYLFDAIERDEQIGIVIEANSWPTPYSPVPSLQLTPIERGTTAEQGLILQQIEQWLFHGRPGIALIHADRGRGKSTCLGILLTRQTPRLRILVTASSRQVVATLLQTAPDAEFVAPDRLLQQATPADLVLVDEAAMIPITLLRQLYRIYPRLVLATTDGGYEGTGKGFMLRFVADLEFVDLQRYCLQQPVRWAFGDRLEAWLNRSLMLASEVAQDSVVSVGAYQLRQLHEPGSASSLPFVRQAYQLLNSAHYRTRPSDLRMLMENPDQVIILAQVGSVVIGVIVLNLEGGFDAELSDQIFLGQRRPRGHLLAQMLAAQAGVKGFAQYRGLRVQRIAVRQDCRRQGIGRALIDSAMQYAREQRVDYVGASFAIDPLVVQFWQQLNFTLVHVSYASGKSSGNNSIAVLLPLNDELDPILAQFMHRIERQLPIWITQFLQNLSAPEIACLVGYAGNRMPLSDLEKNEIEAFAKGNKGFELCFASLQKFVMNHLAQNRTPLPGLLIEKGVQNRAWELLESDSGEAGRKQLQRRLRGYVDALLQDD